MRRTAEDFSGTGAGNPFAQGGDSATNSVAPTDPQMQNSVGTGMGGDDLNPAPTETANTDVPTNSVTTTGSRLFDVACLDCGKDYVFGRVSASMRCICGSDNMVYESSNDAVTGEEPPLAREYPDSILGYVSKTRDVQEDPTHWYWNLSRQGTLLTHGWAHTQKEAQQIVDHIADIFVKGHERLQASKSAWRVVADGTPPFEKKDDDKDDKKKDDSGDKSDSGDSSDKPSGDSGSPAPAPNGGQSGSEPPADPNAVPVDPNAPQVPGVPGEVQDPLLQAMDTAQQQVDQTVEQTNQLGHDAKEVAYDVDQLFSEWRCMNCQLEGRADISEDGQVQIGGDLFDNQPCSSPAPPEPDPNQMPQQQQPQPGGDPNQQLPQGSPAAGGQAPQQIPQQTASRKTAGTGSRRCLECGNFYRTKSNCPECGSKRYQDGDQAAQPRKRADLIQHDDDTQKGPNQRNVADQQDGEDGEDDALQKEEIITTLAEGILASNPGMNVSAARKIAEDTVNRFPSTVG